MHVYIRSCQKFCPRFIISLPCVSLVFNFASSVLQLQTHTHTDTHTSSIVRPRSKAITRMCVCVCVSVCVCMWGGGGWMDGYIQMSTSQVINRFAKKNKIR